MVLKRLSKKEGGGRREEEEEEGGGGGGGWELDDTVSEGFSAIVDLDHAKCVRVSLNLKMNENKNSR